MTENQKDHRLEDALAYAQDFLEPPARAEFEAHLKDCAACQATLARVSEFLPKLQKALNPPLRSTDELLAAAKAEVRARAEARTRRAGVRTRVRVAWAALALAAGTAVFVLARPLFVVKKVEYYSPRRPDPGQDQDAGPDGGR